MLISLERLGEAGRGRERQREHSYSKGSDTSLATRSRKFPPASCAAAQMLPNSCPNVASAAELRTNVGRHLPMGRFGPNFGSSSEKHSPTLADAFSKSWPDLAKFVQALAAFDQFWPISAEVDQHLAKVDQFGLNFGQSRPMLVEVCRTCVKGATRPEFGPNRPSLAAFGPNLVGRLHQHFTAERRVHD